MSLKTGFVGENVQVNLDKEHGFCAFTSGGKLCKKIRKEKGESLFDGKKMSASNKTNFFPWINSSVVYTLLEKFWADFSVFD